MTRARFICFDSRGRVKYNVVFDNWEDARRRARAMYPPPGSPESRRRRKPCGRVLILDLDWEKKMRERGVNPYG